MAGVDFGFFLGRKYAILQQQADAASQNADTARMTGVAGAKLDLTRANWLPRQAAAEIAQAGAQTNLIGEQAKIVAPESRARIGQINADAAYTTTQDKVLTRGSLTPFRSLFGDPGKHLSGVMGSGYQLGQIVPQAPARATAPYGSAAWLDQQNGF